MSGGYSQTIGPAQKRLKEYLIEVVDNNKKGTYTTLELVQYDVDRVTRAVNLIESYNDKWITLLANITDDDKRATEEAIYKNFTDAGEMFATIQSGREAINLLDAERRGLLSNLKLAIDDSTTKTIGATPQFVLADHELPTFDGNIFEWSEFYEIFKADVETQPIPEIRKFTKLKSCLRGNAANAIAGLPVTSTNYLVALEILKDQFGKSLSITSSLFTQLKNVDRADDSTTSMRKVYQDINNICRQLLMTYKQDIDHPLVIQTIVGKFPESTMLKLDSTKTLAQWKYKDLMEKLHMIISSKEDVHRLYMEASTHSSRRPVETTTFAIKSKNNQPRATQQNGSSRIATKRESHVSPCFFCSDVHLNKDCSKFPTGKERSARLQQLNRCLSCLKPNHDIRNCSNLKQCEHCGKTHNSIVCWNHYPSTASPKMYGNRTFKAFPQRSAHVVTSTPNQTTFHVPPSSPIPRNLQPRRNVSQANVRQSPLTYPNSINSRNNQQSRMFQNSYIASNAEPAKTIMSMINAVKNASTVSHQLETLLLTARCRITNPNSPKNSVIATVFFDGGSQKTFVSDHIKELLDLEVLRTTSLTLHTFGSERPQHIESGTVQFDIATSDGEKRVEAQCVQKLIQPIQAVNLTKEDYQLMVDAQHLVAEKVEPDILIGIEYYWQFFNEGASQQLPSGFHYVNSKVGPMISGQGQLKAPSQISCYSVVNTLSCLPTAADEKERTDGEIQTLQHLEDLETIGIHDDPYTDEQAEADKLLEKEIEMVDGRYQVPWLWKNRSQANLASNYQMAIGQLKSLLLRIKTLPNSNDIIQKYVEYFKELEDLKIIEAAPEYTDDPTVYLPYHVVFKSGSATTKFRVVYNASAKSRDGLSLNENLFRGPIRIPDLAGILLRFREQKYVIISDIEKAFLQISLKPCDRNTTCFIWLRDPMGPFNHSNMLTFRFTRIAFGVICSPYLLSAVITHHLNKIESPLSDEILRSIYVDNVMFTADSPEEAKQKIIESKSMFATATMNLREHISNSPEINDFISKQQPLPKGPHKILGIPWDTTTDTLVIHSLQQPEPTEKWTKRKVLKTVAQAFDPLGFLVAVHLQTKIFFQSLWKKNYTWDQELSTEDLTTWMTVLNDICGAAISIPRFLMKGLDKATKAELHVFVDASKYAYAAVCYVKLTPPNAEPTTKLVFAKTRLCPAKGLSIPKLELLGMYIGVKCAKFIKNEMTYNFEKVCFWSDSYCVIYWINSKKEQKRFIENRLKEIRSFPEAQFRYVPTEVNPADKATRGVPAEQIKDLEIWWKGPEFLLQDETQWPTMPEIDSIIEEEPNPIVVQAVIETIKPVEDFMKINKFNSFDKLLITTAFVLRFVALASKSISRLKQFRINVCGIDTDKEDTNTVVTMATYHAAETILLRISQTLHPPTKNEEKTLRIYVDEKETLRCITRIRLFDKDDIRNHPHFLPTKANLTKLILLKHHQSHVHCGASQVLANIRQLYWIPKGRNAVRSALSNCLSCRRQQAKPFKLPQMAELPDTRLKPSKPFQFIGLDYLGPMMIMSQGNIKVKKWICLITCLTTRAVHLDHVDDLSSVAFLNCLRRFFSRRGLPEKIISDNATQFVLVSKALQKAYSQGQITWIFNVPLAPWQGGIFERLVALVKNAFRKSIGKRCLQLDDFNTLLCEVENAINCRPITAINAESSEVLRPIDFLIPEFSDPSISFDEDPTDAEWLPPGTSSQDLLIQQWNLTKKHLKKLWEFWSTDYLTLLRERVQHQHKQQRSIHDRHPMEGEIVIVQDDSLPKTCWKLARITEVHRSPDNEIRSATIKIESGKELRRPINRLFPLELQEAKEPDSRKSSPKSISNKNVALLTVLIMSCLLINGAEALYSDHKCPDDSQLERIDSTECSMHNMAVMKMHNDNLCWSIITCTHDNNANNENHCSQCTCPSWSEGCSFYNGPLTIQSDQKREEVSEALKSEKPKICSFSAAENCDEKPHIGRFQKIILFDNSSHIVNELHLLRQEIQQEEITCIGNGTVIGSPQYCKTHQCATDGTRFCYYKQAEAVFIVTDHGNILIKEWGTVLLQYYKYSHSLSPDCTSCLLTCMTTGVELIVPSHLGTIRICVGTHCLFKQNPSSREQFDLPHVILVTTHKVTAVIWSQGFVIRRLEQTCSPKNICQLIKCIVCWEILGNPQCMPNIAIFVISGIIVSILMAVYHLIKIIQKSARALVTITHFCIFMVLVLKRALQCFVSIIAAAIRMCRKATPNQEYNLRNGFRYVPRQASTTLMILGMLLGAQACSEVNSITANQEACLREKDSISCKFNQQTLLSLSPQGQTTCLMLKDNNGQQNGMIKLAIARLAAFCVPKTEYYTREYLIKSKSAKRCRGAGSCHNNVCEDTQLNSKIEEFNDDQTTAPGYSYCQASCGCISCGCFLCSPGCLFWRNYALPKSETIFEVFSCLSWQTRLKIDATIQVGNKTTQHTFNLTPGQTAAYNHIKISLISASLPTVPALQSKFVTDYRRIALTAASEPGQQVPGTVGDFQCRTHEDARDFKCSFSPNGCTCHATETQIRCVCQEDLMSKLFSTDESLLPVEFGGTIFQGVERTVMASYKHPTSVQVQLETQDLVTTITTNTACNIQFGELHGCYNCVNGAEVKATCTTSFGTSQAFIDCDGAAASMHCDNTGHQELIKFQLHHNKIEIECKIKCSMIETRTTLRGSLVFAGHDIHPGYGQIANEEIAAAASFDFGFLFSWMALKEQVILILTAIGIMFLLIAVIKANPYFRLMTMFNAKKHT